jgi:thiol:disulfide interchange protein DsbA
MFSVRPTAQRIAFSLLAAMLLAPAGVASAQQPRARINYEYRLIEPQRVETGTRIEVIEFFWYGCPYCNALQPSLDAWAKRKPADVALRHIPAVFRQSWVPHARIYYTLEALGELERLHQDVYRTYHVEHERLASSDAIADWAAKRGIDRARWVAAFESRDIERKVEQAVTYTRAYAIEGTPSLVVDGRYVTSTAMSETIAGVITILEDLVVMAREARAGK